MRNSPTLIKTYRCSRVYGDRYAGEWPREQFQKRGVFYEPADRSKSEIYVDLLPLIDSRAIDLLDHDRLLIQLTSLERRTSRAGKDSIDHAPGAHDDVANAVAGALVTAYQAPGDPNFQSENSLSAGGGVILVSDIMGTTLCEQRATNISRGCGEQIIGKDECEC